MDNSDPNFTVELADFDDNDAMGSQKSELSEGQLQSLEETSRPQSTMKATKQGIKKFENWLEKRGRTVDYATVSAEELASILRKFYAEVKHNQQGKSLTPSSLTGIRAAIHRHLTAAPFLRTMNIVKDKEFLSANNMFQARCRLYYRAGNPKPRHKPVIEDSDMAKLGNYFTHWKSQPSVLQECVWYSLCYHFGRRGREGWTSMMKNTFTVKTDSNGEQYVCSDITESTKNVKGGAKQHEQDYSDSRMYGQAVEIFIFYFSKLHPDLDRLFQKPRKDQHFMPDDETWFTREPVGKNTLSQMMQRISKNAKLSKEYTCHSIRATTITTLFRAGATAQEIMSISKHRNASSLGHYISDISTEQKKRCSSVLAEKIIISNEDVSSYVILVFQYLLQLIMLSNMF